MNEKQIYESARCTKLEARKWCVSERKRLKNKQAPKCPDCGSKKTQQCIGGTCYYPIKGIRYICIDCVNEW